MFWSLSRFTFVMANKQKKKLIFRQTLTFPQNHHCAHELRLSRFLPKFEVSVVNYLLSYGATCWMDCLLKCEFCSVGSKSIQTLPIFSTKVHSRVPQPVLWFRRCVLLQQRCAVCAWSRRNSKHLQQQQQQKARCVFLQQSPRCCSRKLH